MTFCHEVHNFSAGPAAMPAEVMARAHEEFRDWHGTGMSVLEMPFTHGDFPGIMESARAKLRRLLSIPDNFHILFLQGGASAQFSLIPMNLLAPGEHAVYIETGHWSVKAIQEGRCFGDIRIGASSRITGFTSVPQITDWCVAPHARYCHITSNETANGLAHHRHPDTGAVPLVADMTSDFLARPIPMTNYGLVYAGAQKNIGPAGLVVVVIRDDLVHSPRQAVPPVFSYQAQVEANNRLNTPLTYSIYLADLVFDWIEAKGGVRSLYQRNWKRSQKIYQLIDQDGFYCCPVDTGYRSIMNICFRLPTADLEQRFLREAADAGLLNLGGHTQTGGVRASLYNALPDAAVETLFDFMIGFRLRYG